MNKISPLDIICMVVLAFIFYILALIAIFSGYGLAVGVLVGGGSAGILLWRWHRVLLTKLGQLVKPVDPA